MFLWELASTPFDKLLAFSEAAEIWCIDQSTLRKAVANNKLIEGRDCRKFGKQWVVTVDAMIREYGGRIKWANFAETHRIPLP